jgi:aminomuconate-semialdehyde/2-hydroxymuconate-6-semialdehyde dehydrogenase
LEKLKAYAQSLSVGDPLKSKTKMGPLCSKDHYDKVISFIKLAVKNGHQIVCGETVDKKPSDCDENGYFVLPTIITNLDDQSELMKRNKIKIFYYFVLS